MSADRERVRAIPSILALAALIAMLALNVGPQRTNAALRRELAAVEEPKVALPLAWRERHELTQKAAAVADTTPLRTELETLRQHASALRRQVQEGYGTITVGNRRLIYTPRTPRREILQFQMPEALSSPSGAWQAMTAARMGEARRLELLEATTCFDAPGRARLEAFLAALPDDVRMKYRCAEGVVTPVFHDWLWKGNPPQRYSPDGDLPLPVDPTRAVAHVKITYASGEKRRDAFSFQRFDDGWRYGPLTESDAEQLLALLDPVTGRPKHAQP